MALTIRNSFPNASGASSQLVALPSGTTNNDLLLLLIVTANDVIPTAPGGFQLVAEVTGVTRTGVYQKIAGSSEPAEYWVSWPSGNGTVVMIAIDSSTLTYPAVHQVATASSNSASASKVWNGVTNTDANTLLLCFGGFGSSAATTPDGAMTERSDVSNTPRAYLMTQGVAATGATGTRTATGSSVTNQRCITISVTETNTYPITYPAEVAATAIPVLAEIGSDGGLYVTQMEVYAEIAAAGIYLTELPVYAEFAAIGIYLTSLPVLVELEYEEPEILMPTYFPVSAGTRRMHKQLPDEITGYAFDPEYSWWSTIVAEESENMIINPSFERWNSSGNVLEYDEGGSFTALDWVEFPPVGATAGRRCAKITTGATVGWLAYDEGLQVSPGAYTFSLDVYVTRAPAEVRLLITGTNLVTTFAQRTFTVLQTGWQRLSLTYVELGAGNREAILWLPTANPAGVVVYTDAWQFEKKPYATTYLDGDMIGFSDSAPYQSYYWHGEPHQSKSTRRARTGSGGRVVAWSNEAHFKTTSIIGLGMAGVEQKTQVLGDGTEIHLGSVGKGREFTITGRIFANNPRALINQHNDLVRLLKPNNTLGGDQMILRFQEVDDAEHLIGAPLDIVCAYREGLQGNITGLYQEALPLQFKAVQPFPMDTIESSAPLTLNQELYDNTLVYIDEFNGFHNLGTDPIVGGVVARVGFMRDGSIVAIGNYDEIGGDGAQYVAYWDGEDWVQLGTGGPSGPTDIDDGYKLGYPLTVSTVGGDVVEFTELGSTWDTLGAGFLLPVEAIQRDTNGDIWIGGQFEFASDGVTKYRYVAKWNSADEVWETIAGGLGDPYDINDDPLGVYAVLATNDGSVYFGGSFGDAFDSFDPSPGEVLAKGVVRWDIATSTWNRVGTGLAGTVRELLRGKDGYIYATGNFDTDAGLNPYDVRGFARFNGFAWEEVFPLVRQDGAFGAEGMFQDENGIFWFYNYAADPETDLFVVPGIGEVGFFGWRDGVFYPPYIQNVGLMHAASGPGGRTILVHHRHTGSDILVPALNEIEYAGTADAPMAVHLHGSGIFHHILSTTTEGGVYGRENGVLLSDNEEMLLRTDSQRTMVYSNQRFNMQTQIAAGASNLKALRLRPGLNRISVYVTDADADLAEGWLTWKNRFWALQDGRGG